MNIEFFYLPVVENRAKANEGKLSYFDNADFGNEKIVRVYSVMDVKAGIIRGHHAHKKLKQYLFCNYGAIKVTLTDGIETIEVILDHPSKVLYIGPMMWHTMEWLIDDSALVVLASDNYNESDYIRSYEAYLGGLYD